MICKNPEGGTPPPNFTQGGGNGLPPPLETAYAYLIGLDNEIYILKLQCACFYSLS